MNEIKIFRIDNVLDLTETLGKTAEGAKIGDEYVNKSSLIYTVAFEGKLFGKPAHGNLNFTTSDGKTVDTVYIFSNDLNYDECKEGLINTYGEPEYENEEPYAESVGGVVTSARFYFGNYSILLSCASNYDFISVTIKLKSN